MVEFNSDKTMKKRARVDIEFESDSTGSKRPNLVPDSNIESPLCPKLTYLNQVETSIETDDPNYNPDEIETSIDTHDPDHIPEDILNILNGTDIVQDRDSPSRDLDSVIRSFEIEIHEPTPNSNPTELSELNSYSGESPPDLGYLFGASDDELGLPPTTTSSNKIEAMNDQIDLTIATDKSNAIEVGNLIEFESEFPSHDSLQLGLSTTSDFVTVDGLFDLPEPSDSTGKTWQLDSLPAL